MDVLCELLTDADVAKVLKARIAALELRNGKCFVAIEVADLSMALDLVAGGLGLAFLPHTAAMGRNDIRMVEIDDSALERGLVAARPDRRLSNAGEALHQANLSQGGLPDASGRSKRGESDPLRRAAG